MALQAEYTAEGSVDESDAAAGVSGFGTPWTDVVRVGACTIKHDSAQAMHGTRSLRFERAATTDNGYARYDLPSARSRLQARCYRRFGTALPANNAKIITLRHSAGFMGYIGFDSTGRLKAFNRTGANASASPTSTNPLLVNTWYRIEAAIKKGTGAGPSSTDGTLEFAYYLGDSGTPEFTYSSSAVDTGIVDPISCRFDHNGATLYTDWLDDAAIGDGLSGWLGPANVVPPDANLVGGYAYKLDARTSTVADGELTYAITPSVGVEQIVPGLFLIPPPSGITTYTVTATSSTTGATDSATWDVPPLGSGSSPVRRYIRKTGIWE